MLSRTRWRVSDSIGKVFWFFFSKKNLFFHQMSGRKIMAHAAKRLAHLPTRIPKRRAALVACVLAWPASPAAAGTFTTLYSFQGGSDGAGPSGALIEHDGYLYGTTHGTGYTDCATGICGTLFRIDPTSGAETVLNTFHGGKGVTPLGDIALDHGKLIGTTIEGGANNFGVVFSFDLASGHERVLHSFAGAGDGAYPDAGPTAAAGTYYGTTWGNGAVDNVWGTIFSIDAASGAYNVLYIFVKTWRDGAFPTAPLLYVDGTLYGTAMGGGIKGRYGTAFALDTTSGAFTVLHEFNSKGGDAYEPSAALIDVQGELLGTSTRGGGKYGVVYGIDPTTDAESVLHKFAPAQGAHPGAALLAHGANVYGTAIDGGAHGDGTIYEMNPATGRVRSLYSFSGPDGQTPTGALIYHDGAFYGTTAAGGAYGYGTVFKFAP
jgi:uncharacterized repeat protein (TIGR03803 family)